ncbi:hypothetical protein TanjilG_04672 [Lupinus angustifolius]|uniref:Uncharacterized protein n=1 Tax=Lupinus angustifolius TaxID=3871 RepID=A0A4P1RKC2_LUPAN|nr:PREDICTED: uncharacterized protein LOC109346804 [Lupinus angustifolius]XP_019442146.1 PREDICTED: uncharacterized protein LOC109346804 [Lupinus angustifolius]OIW12508.1 hypothetical protein TanjilG_04672 [Lupinus angustifolius]
MESSSSSSSAFSSVVEKETTSSGVWTDEKHGHFLNTIEASFVTTMLHRYRLHRHLPHTSVSKPNNINNNKHALSPSDSVVPRIRRRTRRRTTQPQNSSQEQVVPQLENAREGFGENDDKE